MTSVFPYQRHLYPSCLLTSKKDASCMCFASLWFLIIPDTFRSSTTMTSAWLSQTIRFVILCMLSILMLAIFS